MDLVTVATLVPQYTARGPDSCSVRSIAMILECWGVGVAILPSNWSSVDQAQVQYMRDSACVL